MNLNWVIPAEELRYIYARNVNRQQTRWRFSYSRISNYTHSAGIEIEFDDSRTQRRR